MNVPQQNKPVLVTIDDDTALRSSIVAYFEDCGYTVLEADNGRSGLELISHANPDVVVTDLRMPVMGGLELIDILHAMDDNLPVIMLSGTGLLSDAIDALRRGAWDYLAKPVHDFAELELMVVRCREQARLVSENRTYHNQLERIIAQRTEELNKLSIAVEQSANGIVITDRNGRIEYVNPKVCKLTGYAADELIGSNPRILKSGRQPESYYRDLWETVSGGGEWRGEFCNRRKDGEEYWENCSIAPVRDHNGQITHFVAIKEDISERRQYLQDLHYQASHDTLTGLPNRYHLQAHLDSLIERVRPDSQVISLFLLDIDNLKFINDTFGHEFGDRLLVEISRRLRQICPPGCIAARFVGDEFVIVSLPSVDSAETCELAGRIRDSIRNFEVDGNELNVTASIGVATWPEDGECVTSLLQNAEAAMYQAKKNGRNTIEYYTRELNSRLMERFELENRLHRALERGEFSIQYQPQVDASCRRIIGVEALLRWTPSGEVPVPPQVFIPLLEESGLIVPVGEWVLEQACSQAIAWQRAGLPPLRISVNISALQFMRSDLNQVVASVLSATGLAPHLLCLELTESMIMADSERSIAIMSALNATGAVLSLDDFGTGYSSLAYLARLPIHELKIDRSFIQRMLTTRNDAAIVSTIIAMGQSLEMKLVAEGVETDEQLAYLLERSCTVMQGFLYSRPLSADGISGLVSSWNSVSMVATSYQADRPPAVQRHDASLVSIEHEHQNYDYN